MPIDELELTSKIEKMQRISLNKRTEYKSAANILSALESIKMKPRDEITQASPPIYDDEDPSKITTPAVSAKTIKVFDVKPKDPLTHDDMSDQRRQEIFDISGAKADAY